MDPFGFGQMSSFLGGGSIGHFDQGFMPFSMGGVPDSGMPGWLTPELTQMMATNPTAFAMEAAKRGIQPPIIGGLPPDGRQPQYGPTGQPYYTNPNATPPLGDSLSPPAPREGDPDAAGFQQTDMSAARKDPGTGRAGKDPIAETLKGLKAPASPEVQKVGTPAAPRPSSSIKSGELIALMQLLGAGGGASSGLKLPSTLGQALGGR